MNRNWAGLWRVALLALLAAGGSSVAAAQSGYVFSDSFESVSLADGSFTLTAPEGWSLTASKGYMKNRGAAGVHNPTDDIFLSNGFDGENVAYINAGVLSKQLNVTLQPNYVYALQVDVGSRVDNCPIDYSISLMAGSNVVARANSYPRPAVGGWESVVLTYESGFAGSKAEKMKIVIENTSDCGQLSLDNVKFVAIDKSFSQ